ncbi:MAG TPA: hypothetical protein VMW68_00805 [Methyloceanibacter sp.]|nr:hypothetical protein [Methyloceanibacter sp.]
MSRNTRWRRVFVVLAAVAVFGGLAWGAVDFIRKWQLQLRVDTYDQEIIGLLDLDAVPDFHARTDKLRAFINDNSVHKIDKAFWANHGDPVALVSGLVAHAKSREGEPIHMECSSRSNLMARVLRKLGYETRIIAIYNTEGSRLNSHSFLEVTNPTTGRWETQDPDYDITWRNKKTGERISIADEAEAIDDVEPCGRASCGWDTVSREGIKAKRLQYYFDIISVTADEKQTRYALYTSRADLDVIYDKGPERGTFCEVEAKRCRQGLYDIREFSSYGAGVPR